MRPLRHAGPRRSGGPPQLPRRHGNKLHIGRWAVEDRDDAPTPPLVGRRMGRKKLERAPVLRNLAIQSVPTCGTVSSCVVNCSNRSPSYAGRELCMFLIDPAELAAKRELIGRYFSSGYATFEQFVDGIDWSSVTTFERDPDSVLRDYRVTFDKRDILRAKKALWDWTAERFGRQRTDYFEFGVRAGVSMRWVTAGFTHPDSRFFGFDTFTGLPDGWVPAWGKGKIAAGYKAGDMAVAEVPSFDDPRVRLYPGLFQDTLFQALDEIEAERPLRLNQRPEGDILIINNDGDTYTAALFTLTSLYRYIRKGDILYFDEFFDTLNEFAAFNDFARSFYFRDRVRLLARAYDACLFEVIS